ncbi:MAG: protein-L-isoaspartate O-methyltransferase family protein, partial [Planctomycetaceae bacterium]
MSTSSRRDQLLTELRVWGGASSPVLEALAAVPRERFVPPESQGHAYDNTALSIDAGQTISQPRMVAEMTTACRLTPQSRVLEVGTG